MSGRIKRTLVVTLTLVVAALAGAVAIFVVPMARNATGFISHTVCDEVFVSGLPLKRVLSETIYPMAGVGQIRDHLKVRIEPTQHRVSVAILGVFSSSAHARRGYGCIVERGNSADPKPYKRAALPDPFPGLAPNGVIAPGTGSLGQAVAGALEEPLRGTKRYTRAVLVIHNGSIIAERYAPGIGPDSRLLGYSMTKSFTNAMIGVLVRKGQMAVTERSLFPQWAGDARARITIEHLMRMVSGLNISEENDARDAATTMLYGSRDMAEWAMGAQLAAPPGTRYEYTSGNTILLSRLIRDRVGGTAESVAQFASHELFEPLGMKSAILETDATGTPVGSTYLLATPRDWARLGLLYLQDGVINGRRILPPGWVSFSTRQTLDSEYGAGFRPLSVAATVKRFRMAGAPSDAFFALGFQGQYMVIVPSMNLIVVRMGTTQGPIGKADGIGRLMRDVIAAVKSDERR